MSSSAMSSLEATFLALETHDVPFVFGCTLELERPVGVDALRNHVSAVLERVPRYRQTIARSWGAARWEDDADFRIDRHVHAAKLPAPGGADELEKFAADLLATDLPRDHSPWRIWTLSGLDGGRGAIFAMLHHSLADGVAGFRLLDEIAGSAPITEKSDAPPAPLTPSKLGLLRKLITPRHLTSLARLLREGMSPASRVGLNPPHVGRDRIVATHAVSLADVAAIERAFKVTNNDVVLATVAGALRRYFRRHGLDADKLKDVRAMVPVARYARGERSTFGNRVALVLAQLPVGALGPMERLQRVSATTRGLKRSEIVGGGDLLMALSDVTTPAMLAGVLRLALWMRAFNLIVTNVPGPRERLNLLGVPISRITPIVNLWPHQSLGVAVASYAGELSFGLQADRAVMPDLQLFRSDLAESFRELVACAGVVSKAAPAREPRAEHHA